MKYIKLFESTKDIINIDNGEVLNIDVNILNKLSDKNIVVWDNDIQQHVYNSEFSSLIKNYITNYKKPDIKPKETVKKRWLNKHLVLVNHYYTCKTPYAEKFVKNLKYKVLDTIYHGKDTENYVFIKYYKDNGNGKKPIRFKMNILSFNKHFKV